MQARITSTVSSFGAKPCLISAQARMSYEEFSERVTLWTRRLGALPDIGGAVVAVRGDYSADACAAIIALAEARAIVVPLSPSAAARVDQCLDVAGVDTVVTLAPTCDWLLERRPAKEPRHALIETLRHQGTPGLILFSSGSTGQSKASVFDLEKLIAAKFRHTPSRTYRTLIFLLLDHIGGINTLLHTLCHGGTLVTPEDRSPDSVCRAIEKERVQLLPTSPTFLNMLLISGTHKRYDLSSLELITYGTEPMPVTTLVALREALPGVKLKQTYGLTELGVLPTQSKESGSLWMKIGGAGFEHKVVDGVLWVRSPSAMLGYINAPAPFDADGWFNTHDMVETDGDYLRILGRRSEIINVGGEKVYPVEVEDALLAAGNVRDAMVFGQANPVTGQVVVAQVSSISPEEPSVMARRLRSFCATRLDRYKVPVRIEIVDGDQRNDRFKKARVPSGQGGRVKDP